MTELYRRVCFRHRENVAYAAIMLARGQSIDDIATEIGATYEGPNAVHRRGCGRVFPPS